ncbi:hypothetical protein QYF36_006884 [Acer negundo]|nr:hypothetical protein QYF36_006884 [Acer negundo]
MVSAIWITEISSPFLHWRELLKELGNIHDCKDDSRALSHFRDTISRQSISDQGNGIWITNCECFLVLQDCKDGQLQADEVGIQKSCLKTD